MSGSTALLWIVVPLATLVVDLKWLRVAQREHYAGGRVTAIATLWVKVSPLDGIAVLVDGILLLVGLGTHAWLSAVLLTLSVIGLILLPWRLAQTGRKAKLATTPRLWRVAILVIVIDAATIAGLGPRLGALATFFSPVVIDAALWMVAPLERRLSRKYVVSARARLQKVRPTVVAITGSYGKTSTKGYAAQLIGGSRTTVASPASFNNLMGLSLTVNKGLVEGTEVFIAEMGTYGPGEIRKLCETFPPDVAAITTIGEAHLERMKDRATIVTAKSEITERPPTVVLNIDVPELAALADGLEATKRVIRCSTSGGKADVSVVEHDGTWSVAIDGEPLTDAAAPPTGHPINLAIAAGLALAVDVPRVAIARALERGLPGAAHRAEINHTADGVIIIDDTYNANPDGAAQALRAARELAGEGRVFTITPGMVELGSRQAAANGELALAATAAPSMTLAVTGRTNREALVGGATGPGTVLTFPDRATAAAAVLKQARAGDVIVYENDLPDHYP